MKYTFIENKFDSKYNKYKLYEYDQFDDEGDEDDDEVENIDQEKIEHMSYHCNDIKQLFDKLFYEDNSLENKEKYIRINKKLLNEIYRNNTPLMEACLKHDADINIEDKKGNTVFDIVKSNAVRKVLEKYRK